MGAYDLILNNYGHHKNIGSVHIAVKGDLTAYEVQTIERMIAVMMYEKYNTIMTVGIYAEINDNELAKSIRELLTSLIKENKNILQMHGFFLDEEHKICNFDLVISFDEPDPEGCINHFYEVLKEKYPDYTFVIQHDRDYSLS